MLRWLRETAPAALVPLAWAVVAAAHLDLVSRRTLLIAHLVMDALLVAFTVLSWADMREGVLRAWLGVLVAGLAVTLAGTAGLAARPLGGGLLAVAILGWMLLPAAGLVYTGRRAAAAGAGADAGASAYSYLAGGVASAVGAAVYAAAAVAGGPGVAPLAGIALAGAGQTSGILAAVLGPPDGTLARA